MMALYKVLLYFLTPVKTDSGSSKEGSAMG